MAIKILNITNTIENGKMPCNLPGAAWIAGEGEIFAKNQRVEVLLV